VKSTRALLIAVEAAKLKGDLFNVLQPVIAKMAC
jgi:hypothetical protein